MSKYRPPALRKKQAASNLPQSNASSTPSPSITTPPVPMAEATPKPTKTPNSAKAFPKHSPTDSNKHSASLRQNSAEARRARFQNTPAQPYGLASRGDNRLQNSSAAQHEFFARIQAAAAAGAQTDSVLADLRVLREAILHAGPSPFLKQVFLFSVRVAAPAARYQTFVPCITYLLESQARQLVSPEEHVELVSLLALQLAHGAGDNAAALAVFFAHLDARTAPRVHAALHAWVRNDYWQWLEIFNSETDVAMRAVMSGGLPALSRHIANTLSAAYFQLDRAELERKFLPRGTTAAEFAAAYAPQWKVGETVILRRR